MVLVVSYFLTLMGLENPTAITSTSAIVVYMHAVEDVDHSEGNAIISKRVTFIELQYMSLYRCATSSQLPACKQPLRIVF